MSNRTSSVKAIFMIVTTMLGVGMYYTPYSFAQNDILVGVFLLLTVVASTSFSIFSLFYSSKRLEEAREKPIELQTLGKVYSRDEEKSFVQNTEIDPEKQESTMKKTIEISYSGIGKYLNSKLGVVIDVMIIVSGISACLFYQKFIGELATTLSGFSRNDEKFYLINMGFIFLATAILSVFAQIRDLSKLSWMASVNIFFISIIGIIIFALNFLLKEFKKLHVENPNRGNVGFALGNFIFAMSCQVNVVKIFTDLEDKSLFNLLLVSLLAPLFCGLIYGCVGIMGALLLGQNMPKVDIINCLADSKSDIRMYIDENHREMSFIPYLMSILTICALMISFIFNFSAVTRSLYKINLLRDRKEKTRWFIITLICFAFITAINLIPILKLDAIFSLIGNFIANPLAFIFPFIFVSKLFGNKNILIKLLCYVAIATSIIFAITNTCLEFSGGAGQLTNETATTLPENVTAQPQMNMNH